ncbi:MAG: hypothetical protein B6D39_01620 [Anaerolineae bacterium UTCFX2]|jgi:hypothetical protein|nr:PH domain-containing protein [Anaerolineales bacterium]OQY94203.1 MAG: hypothetical protein B6D39_01620 [Anaerolineae bacterium UTCFX2]
MQDEYAFQPNRRMGTIFLLGSIVLLTLVGIGGIWQSTQASALETSLLYLLFVLAVAAAVLALAYRVYGLRSAVYILTQGGIRLRWGLRSQDIPSDEILWVHPASELTAPLPLPLIRVPGAVLGLRRIPGGGEIEYLAADVNHLIMIATPGGGYVISPAQPEEFLQIYQRFIELGSLTPLPERAVYPSLMLQRVWTSIPARALLLTSILASLALWVWVSLAISARSEVSLGFTPAGFPADPLPAARLMLLPFLNFLFFLTALLLGLFFFRQPESRPVAFVLWTSSALTAVLYLLAVFFILHSG